MPEQQHALLRREERRVAVQWGILDTWAWTLDATEVGFRFFVIQNIFNRPSGSPPRKDEAEEKEATTENVEEETTKKKKRRKKKDRTTTTTTPSTTTKTEAVSTTDETEVR